MVGDKLADGVPDAVGLPDTLGLPDMLRDPEGDGEPLALLVKV